MNIEYQVRTATAYMQVTHFLIKPENTTDFILQEIL